MDFPASVLNAIAVKHETNYFNDLYLDLVLILQGHLHLSFINWTSNLLTASE